MQLYLTEEILCKVRIFQAAKNFLSQKTNYFCRTKFPTSGKRLQFEVKILFSDHYFFGIKIKKSETDFK